MRMSRLLASGLLAAWTLGVPCPVQSQTQASEKSHVSQTISGTVIEIDYSRPSLRGRGRIFGEIVPWGETWTAGANASTTIRFSKDVTLAGHQISAGTYGVWLQPEEDDPWTFMLHPDTTLFHVPHPPLEEGVFRFPVQPQEADGFVETLRWDFQTVRLDGAEVQLHWGRTLVSVDLGVDPGVRLTVDGDVGRPYEGQWSLQREPRGPEGQPSEPRRVDLTYDQETGQLRGIQQFPGGGSADFVLLPRAEGIFVAGYLLEGEVATTSPNYWEFTFEAGAPVEFVLRNADDEVISRGHRVAH